MRTGLLLLCLLMLQGCGTLERADGPPPGHVDASNVPDAVPRAEPRSRSGNPDSYVVFGQRYYPLQDRRGFVEKGVASWYGRKFHGKLTSSGEPYHMLKMTVAHKTLPLPSYVRVTNLKNGRSIVVRIGSLMAPRRAVIYGGYVCSSEYRSPPSRSLLMCLHN